MEKRRARRWIQEEEVFCYFEGDRLGALSKDLSKTGMFLATAKDVPQGRRVALIFRPRFSADTPIYLVGQVVRRQVEPMPGLGIQWVKAVTDASPLQLSIFLQKLLDLDPEKNIQEAVFEETGWAGAVSTYLFPAARAAAAKPRSQRQSTLELLGKLSVDVVHSDDFRRRNPDAAKATTMSRPSTPAPVPAPEPAPPPQFSGPLTGRVDNKRIYAPCEFPATLVIGGAKHPVRIRGLATFGLFIETDARPAVGAEVGMIFDLKTRSGDARLSLRCDVEAHKDAKAGWGAGLDLRITNPGDPLGAALLKRFVRWLHFRSVADDV